MYLYDSQMKLEPLDDNLGPNSFMFQLSLRE